jgi:hypothetical protein
VAPHTITEQNKPEPRDIFLINETFSFPSLLRRFFDSCLWKNRGNRIK